MNNADGVNVAILRIVLSQLRSTPVSDYVGVVQLRRSISSKKQSKNIGTRVTLALFLSLPPSLFFSLYTSNTFVLDTIYPVEYLEFSSIINNFHAEK